MVRLDRTDCTYFFFFNREPYIGKNTTTHDRYAESKLGLEALMNKWQSEQWSDFVSIAGAVIGWTRGTGLMDTNNMLAASIESCGVRTFSASEMALNIMTLLHPQMVSMAGLEPVWADFGGDFNKVERLNELASKIRKDVRGVRARSARISLFLFT